MTAAVAPVNRAGGTGGVTQVRVITAEATKLRSVRSTFWSFVAVVLIVVGLGALITSAIASSWSRQSPQDIASFDPTTVSLAGTFLAQLAVGVLGVLTMTGEWSTGMARATFAAVPKRLPVLWAKAVVFALVTFVISVVTEAVAFTLGQALLHSTGHAATWSSDGTVRAVIGAALYLTGIGLLGMGIGAILRNTPAAISVLVGLVLILPILVNFLPQSWRTHISKYLPSNAGSAVWTVVRDPSQLGPWTGFAVLMAYVVVAIGVGAALLVRRDV